MNSIERRLVVRYADWVRCAAVWRFGGRRQQLALGRRYRAARNALDEAISSGVATPDPVVGLGTTQHRTASGLILRGL